MLVAGDGGSTPPRPKPATKQAPGAAPSSTTTSRGDRTDSQSRDGATARRERPTSSNTGGATEARAAAGATRRRSTTPRPAPAQTPKPTARPTGRQLEERELRTLKTASRKAAAAARAAQASAATLDQTPAPERAKLQASQARLQEQVHGVRASSSKLFEGRDADVMSGSKAARLRQHQQREAALVNAHYGAAGRHVDADGTVYRANVRPGSSDVELERRGEHALDDRGQQLTRDRTATVRADGSRQDRALVRPARQDPSRSTELTEVVDRDAKGRVASREAGVRSWGREGAKTWEQATTERFRGDDTLESVTDTSRTTEPGRSEERSTTLRIDEQGRRTQREASLRVQVAAAGDRPTTVIDQQESQRFIDDQLAQTRRSTTSRSTFTDGRTGEERRQELLGDGTRPLRDGDRMQISVQRSEATAATRADVGKVHGARVHTMQTTIESSAEGEGPTYGELRQAAERGTEPSAEALRWTRSRTIQHWTGWDDDTVTRTTTFGASALDRNGQVREGAEPKDVQETANVDWHEDTRDWFDRNGVYVAIGAAVLAGAVAAPFTGGASAVAAAMYAGTAVAAVQTASALDNKVQDAEGASWTTVGISAAGMLPGVGMAGKGVVAGARAGAQHGLRAGMAATLTGGLQAFGTTATNAAIVGFRSGAVTAGGAQVTGARAAVEATRQFFRAPGATTAERAFRASNGVIGGGNAALLATMAPRVLGDGQFNSHDVGIALAGVMGAAPVVGLRRPADTQPALPVARGSMVEVDGEQYAVVGLTAGGDLRVARAAAGAGDVGPHSQVATVPASAVAGASGHGVRVVDGGGREELLAVDALRRLPVIDQPMIGGSDQLGLLRGHTVALQHPPGPRAPGAPDYDVLHVVSSHGDTIRLARPSASVVGSDFVDVPFAQLLERSPGAFDHQRFVLPRDGSLPHEATLGYITVVDGGKLLARIIGADGGAGSRVVHLDLAAFVEANTAGGGLAVRSGGAAEEPAITALDRVNIDELAGPRVASADAAAVRPVETMSLERGLMTYARVPGTGRREILTLVDVQGGMAVLRAPDRTEVTMPVAQMLAAGDVKGRFLGRGLDGDLRTYEEGRLGIIVGEDGIHRIQVITPTGRSGSMDLEEFARLNGADTNIALRPPSTPQAREAISLLEDRQVRLWHDGAFVGDDVDVPTEGILRQALETSTRARQLLVDEFGTGWTGGAGASIRVRSDDLTGPGRGGAYYLHAPNPQDRSLVFSTHARDATAGDLGVHLHEGGHQVFMSRIGADARLSSPQGRAVNEAFADLAAFITRRTWGFRGRVDEPGRPAGTNPHDGERLTDRRVYEEEAALLAARGEQVESHAASGVVNHTFYEFFRRMGSSPVRTAGDADFQWSRTSQLVNGAMDELSTMRGAIDFDATAAAMRGAAHRIWGSGSYEVRALELALQRSRLAEGGPEIVPTARFANGAASSASRRQPPKQPERFGSVEALAAAIGARVLRDGSLQLSRGAVLDARAGAALLGTVNAHQKGTRQLVHLLDASARTRDLVDTSTMRVRIGAFSAEGKPVPKSDMDPKQRTFRDPRSGYLIQPERGGDRGHGDSAWKLFDTRGGRIATLDEPGFVLRG